MKFSDATTRMVEKCFAQNELDGEIMGVLRGLPDEMARRLGGSREYWLERFRQSSSLQKVVEDALRWAIRKSQSWNKKEGKPIRHYLKMAIDNGDIPEWISWHARAMEF
ncbi:MAG: hypothetical protein QFX35_05975 [Candidatus Verstraetearchaeota archaeon]|nr:hypothetical protein [Candidatus Verstraetearchaeota archaeon]